MVSLFNLKSYLSNPSRIFKIEAMDGVLWIVKRVCSFFYSPGTCQGSYKFQFYKNVRTDLPYKTFYSYFDLKFDEFL